MLRLLPLLTICLVLLASCTSPQLEGKWNSYDEIDYSYFSPGGIIRKHEPISVIGKYRVEITPDSFIYFDTKAARERRMRAHSYKRSDSLVLIPESKHLFEIKVLTADTLTLLYKHSPAVGSNDIHVNTAYTFTR